MQKPNPSALILWAAVCIVALLLLLFMVPGKNSGAHLRFTPIAELKPLVYNDLQSSVLDNAGDDNAYVTASGTKYHLSPDCSALKRSKSIKKVSMDSVQQSHSPCSLCVDT